MAIYPWLPQQAGGYNLYADATSVPPHQLVQCDNYYPHGRRWRLIQGNSVHRSAATAARVRHLVEYPVDDGALGTLKRQLEFRSDGTIQEIGSGTASALTGPAITASQTMLWDTTIFTGIMLMANGTNNLMETSNASTYIATTGSPPATPQFVEAWKNRVFLVRAAAPLSVAYSADGDRNTWTGADSSVEVIPSPFAGAMTGIRSVENYLALFTHRTITVLIGDHPDDWTKRTLFEDHGCASHRTIAKANGGLIYANDFGVWLLSADLRRVELSKAIRDYWQNPNGSSTKRNIGRSRFMHAGYDPTPDYNRYYIWVSEGTSTAENMIWVFHFNSGEWSKITSFMDTGMACQASCLREDASGNIQTYFSAGTDDNTTSDKKIYKISGSVSSFASRADGNIAATLKTGLLYGDIDANVKTVGLQSTKRWDDAFLKFTSAATNPTNLTLAIGAHSHNALVSTSRTVNIYSGSASFVRPRTAIGRTGYGVDISLSYTGQVDHSLIGGLFSYTETGEM